MNIEDQREIRRRNQVLVHAQKIGSVTKACRYFGLPRSTFYRWKTAIMELGEAGLVKHKPIPKSHPRTTPDQVVEKIIYLRRNYHLGPMRIVWCLQRYHDINICDATVYRI